MPTSSLRDEDGQSRKLKKKKKKEKGLFCDASLHVQVMTCSAPRLWQGRCEFRHLFGYRHTSGWMQLLDTPTGLRLVPEGTGSLKGLLNSR